MSVIDDIKRDEGLRLTPYLCTADKLTIGYGRNLEGNGITEQEADYLLANDVLRVCRSLRKEIDYFDTLDLDCQDALINMCFNLGLEGLLEFKKMWRALKIGHYERAALEALDSDWAGQVGARADRIALKIKGE